MALVINGADSPAYRLLRHTDHQVREHDGQRLNRSVQAGPAAVFSFSQQALDSAKDAARPQPANRQPVNAPAAAAQAAAVQGAPAVETAAALPAAMLAAETRAAQAEPPRAAFRGSTDASTPSSGKHGRTGSSKCDSDAEKSPQVSYQSLLDNVPLSFR